MVLPASRELPAPADYWPKIYLAAIYAQLGRQDEARTAVEELLSLSPEFCLQTLPEELEKYNASDDGIEHWVDALRKAGVPEEPRQKDRRAAENLEAVSDL